MSSYPEYPACLSQGDFALVRFGLELREDGCLALEHLLGIGSLLRSSAGVVLGSRAAQLFDPPLSCESTARRRFQKPAPGFVVIPDPGAVGELTAGDRFSLDLLFLGRAVQSIGDHLRILQQAGERGLTGEGLRFAVVEAGTLGLDGRWRRMWHAAQRHQEPVPDLIRLDAWLEQSWPVQQAVMLSFLTPTRLVTKGKVLRRPRFTQLFPFMLRRVTSMLHACCSLEPVDAPSLLLDAAGDVSANWNTLRWSDWRGTGEREMIGGLTGTVRLEGGGLERILWVLLLATLCGVGKGATYGAGRCRLFGAA